MRITQKKGDTAVAQAIATFTRMGYDVALPLTESAAYDLIVDDSGFLKRVQVKYTSSGEVDLRRVHSNSKGYVVKKSKKDSYDWLYVYHQGNEFLIPQCVSDRRSIKPNKRYLLKPL